jgi:hypothetical protein
MTLDHSHALHFLYSVRVTRVMSLLLYHLGMHNKLYQQNQTGSMNMLSEICNARQSPYPVPSLIEQRKIWDTMILIVHRFLVDVTPQQQQNVQPCRLSNLNLRKDNCSKYQVLPHTYKLYNHKKVQDH